MIQIKSQGSINQYDESGRAITQWDDKKCAWIVLPEFETEEIDWYGNDSDFPGGYTLKEYEANNPNWKSMPSIFVTWYWSKESAIKEFGKPHTFLGYQHPNAFDYWEKQTYPYTASRDWNYLNYSKEEAIEQLGKHCDFNKNAERTVVFYNNEIIFDGELK